MFREKIKSAMRMAGVTGADLSEKTGINKGSISSFLNGSRTISNKNLDLILDTLNLTLVPKKDFKCDLTEDKKAE